MADEPDDSYWIEIVDGEGVFPSKRLGPYANARLADRAGRGALRVLNARRYGVVVLSQHEQQARRQNAEIAG
ncbi:hypothetical protein ACS5PN_09410 [Roseateles sp. NT4]|uniref:hypothetical protein n=1 Tax=Roseateles sp. NT4 TaxID=3453715 RepID=UPI003EEEF717